MNLGITTVISPGKDLEQAKALYGKLLGAAPYADTPCGLEARHHGHRVRPLGWKNAIHIVVERSDRLEARPKVDLRQQGAVFNEGTTPVGSA